MCQWTLGMVTFWTTRGSAVFELYMRCELLLSGRLVPLPLMPEWAQTLANFLPFQWTFGFPIESLVGDMSTPTLLLGLGMQVLWIVGSACARRIAWRLAVIKPLHGGRRMNALRRRLGCTCGSAC